MKHTVWSSLVLLGLAGVAQAGRIDLPRNSVLEVVSEQDLSIKNNREGDRFAVKIENDRELPRGTRLLGEIERIEEARDGRPAYMDLRVNTLELPDGSRERIRAVPISLDSKAISRNRDGRLTADPRKVRTENYVIGGLVGGLVVGALLKKPFEGAFIGTLAGVVLGESERKRQNGRNDLVMRRGTKLGLLLEDDVVINYSGYRRDDRWGRDDRDGRNNRNDRDDRDNRDFSDPIDVSYGNERLRFERDERPYRRGDQTMLPLQSAARQMDLEVERRENRFWVDGNEGALRFEVGSREARVNGRRTTLDVAPEIRNGVVYVPAGLLASLSQGILTVNGTRIVGQTF